MRREGHTVLSFADPAEAIRSLSIHPEETPEMAFIALQLPKMSGYQVIQSFKKQTRFQLELITGNS